MVECTTEDVKRLHELPSDCWYYREFIEHDWQVGMLKGEFNTYSQQRLKNQLEKKLNDKYPNSVFRTEEPLKGYRQWVFDGLCEKYMANLELSDV